MDKMADHEPIYQEYWVTQVILTSRFTCARWQGLELRRYPRNEDTLKGCCRCEVFTSGFRETYYEGRVPLWWNHLGNGEFRSV